MFGSKKKEPRKSSGEGGAKTKNLSQFGLMDVHGFGDDNDDNEAALEAELQQLMSAGSKAKKPVNKKNAMPEVDLDLMVASCMKDIPSGDDMSEDEDPSLLQELQDLDSDDDEVSGPSQNIKTGHPCSDSCPGQDLLTLIDGRITNYTLAERNAKQSGESMRAKRFARGLATLTDLRNKLTKGEAVSEEDIPPVVVISMAVPKVGPTISVPKVESTITAVLSVESTISVPNMESTTEQKVKNETFTQLKKRREECKSAALQAKQAGDKEKAVAALKAVKACDAMIAQVSQGEILTVDRLPEIISVVPKAPPPRQFSRDEPVQMPDNPDEIPAPDPSLFGAPPPPASVAEALQQRFEKYRHDELKAKEEGNDGRARRLGRICKQYTDAIRLHKAGKPVEFEDLPVPPGFGPIPVAQGGQHSVTVSFPKSAADVSSPPSALTTKPKTDTASTVLAAATKPKSLRDKQLAQLEKMQAQFKEAALEAKKAGQMEEAKEYLRHFKGFDKVIEASKCGLPVDFKTLPVPPQKRSGASMDFEIIRKEDCLPEELSNDRQEMFSKLETELIAQVKMCARNSEFFKAMGDVASANKFQQMMEHTKKDLEVLRHAFKRGEAVPRFHYEVRSFSRIVCNADLGDTDFEFSVISGINYAVPKEVQTYCKLEFPYPKENSFKDRSALVKDSSPKYDHKVIVPVNPKDKNYQRVFKRQSAKVEIWSKGGFLRSDTLVGTALIKLQALETVCEIHDTFPLMDGRKAVGGKVEVRLRIRNPMVTKQVEKVEEKWLIITYT